MQVLDVLPHSLAGHIFSRTAEKQPATVRRHSSPLPLETSGKPAAAHRPPGTENPQLRRISKVPKTVVVVSPHIQ